MQLRKTILAVSALALSAMAHAAPTNLIVNGSFEDLSSQSGVQQLNNGQWSVYSSLPGWTTVWGDGIEVRNNVAGTAQDGKHFVELDSHYFANVGFVGAKQSNSAMSQSVATTSGMSYTLSFWYSARPNTSGMGADTNDINVFWNGQLLSLLHPAAVNSTSSHQWAKYSFNVTGTGVDIVKFAATGAQETYGGSLDNVSLIAIPVPEPESYALMLAGLGLIGFSARRRR